MAMASTGYGSLPVGPAPTAFTERPLVMSLVFGAAIGTVVVLLGSITTERSAVSNVAFTRPAEASVRVAPTRPARWKAAAPSPGAPTLPAAWRRAAGGFPEAHAARVHVPGNNVRRNAAGASIGDVATGLAGAALLLVGGMMGTVLSRRTAPNRVALMATGGEAKPQLFGSPASRSPLVDWYLHEVGADFEAVDANAVDRTGPDYPHPFGKIPALRDGAVSVFESGAILMYLAEKYGELDTMEKRAAAGSWVAWANATLDPICFVRNDAGRVLNTKLRGRPPAIDVLDELLSTREWILGEDFSVADVAIGSYLLYPLLFFPDVNVLKWEHVSRYMQACVRRPAYAKAFGDDLVERLLPRFERAPPPPPKKMFGVF